MMKKAVTALICVVLLIAGCFSACSTSRAALTIGQAEIDHEVYLYFLDQAVQESKRQLASAPDTASPTSVAAQEAVPSIDTQALFTRAQELCAEYVAVNTLFDQYGCTLTGSEKSDVSVTTNNLWRLYGSYYEALGVSKQTLYKIELNSAYQSAVLTALYGENGLDPVPEEEIRQYYQTHYVLFRAISGYYTDIGEDGSSVPMSEEKRAETDAAYDGMAEKINAGTDLNTVYSEYLQSQGYEESQEAPAIRVTSADSKGYPEGFFDAVNALEVNRAAVIKLDGYIYVILRLDPYTEDSAYYMTYQSSALKGVKAADFQLLISQQAQAYAVTADEAVQSDCIKKIRQEHPSVSFR